MRVVFRRKSPKTIAFYDFLLYAPTVAYSMHFAPVGLHFVQNSVVLPQAGRYGYQHLLPEFCKNHGSFPGGLSKTVPGINHNHRAGGMHRPP